MKMLCIKGSYGHCFTLYEIYEVWQDDSGGFFVTDNEGEDWPLLHHDDGFYKIYAGLVAVFVEVRDGGTA